MYHYNGLFYVSHCDLCGDDLYAETIREMKTLDDFHECGKTISKITITNERLVEFVPTAEFVKPMFTTNRF